MKYLVTVVVLAVGMAGSAFGQDAGTAVCADYAAMDNAGKMAMAAELKSMNSEMASSQEVSSVEIQANLDANCTTNPDQLVIDAWKALHE